MPPPSCRPLPTIANGCSFCGLCPFAVTHLHGTGLVSQQPRAARDVLVSWVQAINRPLSEATQPGADSALGAGSTRSPLVRHLNAARTTVGNDGQRRAGGSKGSQLRASCGQEVQQPEGRSPLDCHMAGRAPTKRMRGDSHAESPAPRCRAVPARTHLRSRLTPCPPPTGPPARPAFSIKARFFFFRGRRSRSRGRLLHSVWSTCGRTARGG